MVIGLLGQNTVAGSSGELHVSHNLNPKLCFSMYFEMLRVLVLSL